MPMDRFSVSSKVLARAHAAVAGTGRSDELEDLDAGDVAGEQLEDLDAGDVAGHESAS